MSADREIPAGHQRLVEDTVTAMRDISGIDAHAQARADEIAREFSVEAIEGRLGDFHRLDADELRRSIAEELARIAQVRYYGPSSEQAQQVERSHEASPPQLPRSSAGDR